MDIAVPELFSFLHYDRACKDVTGVGNSLTGTCPYAAWAVRGLPTEDPRRSLEKGGAVIGEGRDCHSGARVRFLSRMRSHPIATSTMAATGIPIPRPIFEAVSSLLLEGITVTVGVEVTKVVDPNVAETELDEVGLGRLEIRADAEGPGDAEERGLPLASRKIL